MLRFFCILKSLSVRNKVLWDEENQRKLYDENSNFISNQADYSTVVHTLIEDPLSPRYFNGSWNNADATIQPN